MLASSRALCNLKMASESPTRRQGAGEHREAEIVVCAVGWQANTVGLELDVAGVSTDDRGFVAVDSELRTTAPHIFAAGDVTGRVMVVHEAAREAYLAASNAVAGRADHVPAEVSPLGSFTDPEYASVGLTEEAARERCDVVVGIQRFDALPRSIIDGRTTGFCKLVADRREHTILGCHIVGERAAELAQLAAVAMARGAAIRRGAVFVPHVCERPGPRCSEGRQRAGRKPQRRRRRWSGGGCRPRVSDRLRCCSSALGRAPHIRRSERATGRGLPG